MIKYDGEIPSGVNIEDNIREIQEYSKTHGYDQALYYFKLKVQAGGRMGLQET